MRRVLIGALVWLLVSGLALATPLSAEQQGVQTFVKKLYSIESKTFEMGRFDGKFNRDKQAELHASFFSKDLLSSVQDVTSVDGSGYVRHPSLGSEDLSQISGINPTKNPKMRPPVVNGDSAYVDVYPDNGRTIYFLTRTPGGWRISNTASYNVWPRNDGTCWEPFYLAKPTPEQLQLETKECIKYRQSQLGKK
jgi:hypothetical protein